MTWRASEELAERVRRAAAHSGRSVNEFISRVLDAATDPELADSEADQIRARLRRAEILVDTSPWHQRPDPAAVARARRAAGSGTSLSDQVSRDRG